MHKHLCSGFGEGGAAGGAGSGERTGRSHSSNHRHRRRWGWHRARTMLTRGSSVGSRVLRLKWTSPHGQASPCAILRVHGQNAPCSPRVQNTPAPRVLCFTRSSLILPADQAEDQLLLFLVLRKSSSPSEGKQPALLCITTDPTPQTALVWL